jgi:hypothetical protein
MPNETIEKTVEAVWVIARYKGEQAKTVAANAHAGVGSYIVIDNVGSKMNPEVVVAFRMVPTNGIPDHLVEVRDPFKIRKYEEQRIARQGGREDRSDRASDSAVETARRIFQDRKTDASGKQ